jgi:hypothetical protein
MRSPARHASIFPSALKYFQQVRKPPGDRKTTDDLAPQLAEFDLRCQAQDFNTAVRVVFEFDCNHLYLWGYYRLMAELHERVQGKLTDPLANENSIGMLGHAYYRMGSIKRRSLTSGKRWSTPDPGKIAMAKVCGFVTSDSAKRICSSAPMKRCGLQENSAQRLDWSGAALISSSF